MTARSRGADLMSDCCWVCVQISQIFIFLLVHFEYYQLQLKTSASRSPASVVVQRRKETGSAVVKQATLHVFSRSFPSSDWRSAWHGHNLCSSSNQKCTGNLKRKQKNLCSSSKSRWMVNSSASTLAPKLRMTERKAYSVFRRLPWISINLVSKVVVFLFFQQLGHLCMYRLILANLFMWMYKCF